MTNFGIQNNTWQTSLKNCLELNFTIYLMKFRSNNILVTGGAGFIGSNFIKVLLDKYRNIRVVNLDALTYAGNIKNTNTFKFDKRYTFIKGNICNSSLLDDIFKNHKIDGVINFAAESHVDNSIKDPKKVIQTNIIGVYKLLGIAVTRIG